MPQGESQTEKQEILHRSAVGLRWTAGARLTAQIISWGSTLIVVRFIAPSEYGLYAMAFAAFTLLEGFSQFGLAAGIVQAKDVTRRQMREILGLLLALNLTLFAINIVAAPYAARYYDEPQVAYVLPVVAGLFLFSPWTALAEADLARKLAFRARALSDLSASVIQAILTLILAIAGFGVWAMVIPQLVRAGVVTLAYNAAARTPLVPRFGWTKIRALARYGAVVTTNDILWRLSMVAPVFIGGAFTTATQIGFYTVALNLARMPVSKVMPLVNQIAFPALSKLRRANETPKGELLDLFRILTGILGAPLLILAALSRDTVAILFGATWAGAAAPLAILALVMPLRLVADLFGPIVQAAGKPEIAARNSALVLVILSAGTVLLSGYGANGLAVAWAITIPASLLQLTLRGAPLGGFTPAALGAAILPILVAAGAAAAVAFGLSQTLLDAGLPAIARLLISGTTGAGVYVIIALTAFPQRSRSAAAVVRRFLRA